MNTVAEIIRKLHELGAVEESRALSGRELLEKGVPVLTPEFGELVSFGAVVNNNGRFYLDLEGLRSYRTYRIVHTIAGQNSMLLMFLVILIPLFLNFTMFSFIIAIGVYFGVTLPLALREYLSLRLPKRE